ncbi:efflux RND transporter periplasmic adaptor subunit [Piscinibacter sp.]|jgi:HlyD family secretion protein|uniref:efflux RND transporter periplasmic adaptor subunit n=1 Tax=Piscinibacter sp. TaxID=1903157 RepID=UPI001B64DE42|nr:efflux RND transporter periplasmic adaptor subunit [Piscinibacter sp.]MBK7533591.1 efflux RND transporter periplasmic adaptor subunit [Piscinibacter sp.]MBP6541005.1 efflux RND transporter periplasmic adaptor subunit [Piscinibacter sp.]HPG79040.1 efflux RND transporter periplasmic adaptor subunit [Piscinibacter sp.]
MKFTSLTTRRLVLGLLGAALLIAMLFVLMRSGPLAPTKVTVVQASQSRLTPALFGIGTVEARRSYVIGPTVAGRVRAVAVDAGDRVKAGQLLAEMDPVDLDERTAALDASIARAGSAMAAAEAQRRDALAKRELAAINARRYVELGAQNFISAGAVEARLQEQASAEAGVSAAQANLAAARQDQQRLSAERAGLRQQRANVRLMAPSDGIVTSRDAEPGSTVVAGQAVVRVIEPASLWVKARFDQGRSAGLAVGLPAQIVLRSSPGAPLSGKVARVEAVSDSVTEERVVQVSFDQLPGSLSVGELAEVTLSLPATASAVVLPNAAIKRLQGQTGVWAIDATALHFAPVRLGQASLDGQVQVLEGLQAGSAVVVYSEKELGASSRIKVVESLAGRRP